MVSLVVVCMRNVLVPANQLLVINETENYILEVEAVRAMVATNVYELAV